MTVATVNRSGAALTAEAGSDGRRNAGTPLRIIQVYAVLLVLIPPTQVIGPLGAIGTPATVVALVCLILWVVAALRPGDQLCRTVVPVRVVMGLLVGTFFLCYAVLHVRYAQGAQVLGSDRAVLQVLSWAGVCLLAAEGLRDKDEFYRVLRTLVVAVAVMAVVGFLQFRFGIDLARLTDQIPGLHENVDLVSIQDRSGFRRSAGTATHPIEFGCVIAITLPLALHLARFDLARSSLRRWLPVAAIAIGIPVAVSRSAVLGALVAAVVMFLGLDPRLRPRALGSAAAFIVVIYATTPGLLGTLRNLFASTGSDSRINDYGPAAEQIRHSPWLGQGPGTFLADSNNNKVLDNQYLLTTVEIGLIGLAVVIAYLLATAFLGRGARLRSKDSGTRDLGQALAASSLAAAVTAFTFDAFSFRMFAGVIPLCLGVAGALWKRERTAGARINDGQSVEVVWVEVPREEPAVAAVDAPARDLPWEYAALEANDVPLPPAATLTHDRDGWQLDHQPDADDLVHELVIPGTEAVDITPHSPGGRPRRHPSGNGAAPVHDLRRVGTLICACVAVMVLGSLPF